MFNSFCVLQKMLPTLYICRDVEVFVPLLKKYFWIIMLLNFSALFF